MTSTPSFDAGDVGAVDAFFNKESWEDLNPRRRLTWRVGDTAREIIERLVDTRATEADLEMVADQLDLVAERLANFEHGRRYEGYGEASTAGGVPSLGHADFSPLIGRANPIAPPMVFELEKFPEAPVVSARVKFGSAYEGPPGCVHGGVVAAAFDEVMGATQALTGSPGMTGTLSVRYLAPTPLATDLLFRARVDSVEGRKISVTAELIVEGEPDVVCASSTGLFISVDFDKLRLMQADRDASMDTGD